MKYGQDQVLMQKQKPQKKLTKHLVWEYDDIVSFSERIVILEKTTGRCIFLF